MIALSSPNYKEGHFNPSMWSNNLNCSMIGAEDPIHGNMSKSPKSKSATKLQIKINLSRQDHRAQTLWRNNFLHWRKKCRHPGRTFLGKRRYFSGIAALTPLTPLTNKRNVVNAFIPTKTPLTALFFLSNDVKAFTPTKKSRYCNCFSC